MPYDPILVEFDAAGRWITLRRAGGLSGEQAEAVFQVREGFTRDDVVAAALGTGWVVDREGDLLLDRSVTCRGLAETIGEMLFYFDAPGAPSSRLVEIKQAAEALLAGEIEGEAALSPWVYAWLDLAVRDDAQDEVLAARDVWRTDALVVDLRKHRARRIRQVAERCLSSGATAQAARMAPSRRSRRQGGAGEREVG